MNMTEETALTQFDCTFFVHIIEALVSGAYLGFCQGGCTFYVMDWNIMYLTDASRFLISCVIQHYAPVVGWGGGGTDA